MVPLSVLLAFSVALVSPADGVTATAGPDAAGTAAPVGSPGPGEAAPTGMGHVGAAPAPAFAPRMRLLGDDPRLDPEWAERDRRLRATMIGVGVFTGTMLLALFVTGMLGLRAVLDDCDGDAWCWTPRNEGAGLGDAAFTLGIGAIVGGAGLTGVGIAWSVHRRPLRNRRVALGPGGLTFGF